jgi:hypothetical protein
MKNQNFLSSRTIFTCVIIVSFLNCNSQVNELLLNVHPGFDLTNLSLPIKEKAKKNKKDTLNQKQTFIKSDTSIAEELQNVLLNISDEKKIFEETYFQAQQITMVKHNGFVSAMHNLYNIPAWVSHAITKQKIENPDKNLTREGSMYPKDPEYIRLSGVPHSLQA